MQFLFVGLKMGRWSNNKLSSNKADTESQISTAEPDDSCWELSQWSDDDDCDTVELGPPMPTAPQAAHSLDTPSGEMLLTNDEVRYQIYRFQIALRELNCVGSISFHDYASWFGLFEDGMGSAMPPCGGFGIDIFADPRGRGGLFNYIVFKYIAQSLRSWRSVMHYFDNPEAFHEGWFCMPPEFSKAAAMTPVAQGEPLKTYPAIFLRESPVVYRMICEAEAIAGWRPWNVHATRALHLRLVIRR